MDILIFAIILFVLADILLRYILKRYYENKAKKERASALDIGLKIDFSHEAKTLKRVEVENPKARILCVDDEEVILDSFRKILVIDGYSVDTVENGKEALGLIQTHHYDFVFTDLKMPNMDGVEVTKSVKHLRPDIDVIIITGYATVETAVETMKYGAMDYVQKPFTEDELLEFTKKSFIKREENIKKELKPKVHITNVAEITHKGMGEFSIPGGVFISEGHCWANLEQDGTVKIGIDDFAKKLIGKIDDIQFPNLGMNIKSGQPLFRAKQGKRSLPFGSPISGKVAKLNTNIVDNLDALDISPYEKNWICIIDADNIDSEFQNLKIGKTAVAYYQDEIERCRVFLEKSFGTKKTEMDSESDEEVLPGAFEKLDDKNWEKMINAFFTR